MAWPHDVELWGKDHPRVVDEFLALCQLIGRRERIELLVHESLSVDTVAERLAEIDVGFHPAVYGDIWMRDTAPLFVRSAVALEAVAMVFNGWGQKYLLEGDTEVAAFVSAEAGVPLTQLDWIGEGGALDFDDAGNCLASAACLFSSERNAQLPREQIEGSLCETVGSERVIWLSGILQGDHTDGHVDTLARFVGPDTVVCSAAVTSDDPNADTLGETRRELEAAGGLDILELPSPGIVSTQDGELLPASYLNFYIGNGFVAVPSYGSREDDEAVARIAQWFPDREVVGLSARGILGGGGAFHCITQQEPLFEP